MHHCSVGIDIHVLYFFNWLILIIPPTYNGHFAFDADPLSLHSPRCDYAMSYKLDARMMMMKLSLQCYSVLSTIAQVLRKMSLKILVS